MSVVYATSLKTTRMNDVVTAIGVGGAGGILKIGTAGMATVLASITLQYPNCGTVSSGVLTFSGLPLSATAGATGTAAAATITDSNNNVIVSGLTVGTSGTDIIISNTSINSGQTVNLTGGTITHG